MNTKLLEKVSCWIRIGSGPSVSDDELIEAMKILKGIEEALLAIDGYDLAVYRLRMDSNTLWAAYCGRGLHMKKLDNALPGK